MRPTSNRWNPEDLHCNPVKWALLGDVAWRSYYSGGGGRPASDGDGGADGMIEDIGSWVVGACEQPLRPTRQYSSHHRLLLLLLLWLLLGLLLGLVFLFLLFVYSNLYRFVLFMCD